MKVWNIFGCAEHYDRATEDLQIDGEGVVSGQRTPCEPPDEEEVQICTDFLSRCQPTKTGRTYSYSLKHIIENWSEARGGKGYVSNGSTILAAKRLGLVIEVSRRGPNAFLGISQRSIGAVCKGR